MVKNSPAKLEKQVQSLSQEEPLEKEMATHSSILAWRIPRTGESGMLYSPWGCKELNNSLVTKQHQQWPMQCLGYI